MRALFLPISSLPQWPSPHDVDNWPPAPAFLPHPAQPPLAYAHHPAAYVAPPTSQPATHAYSVTTGFGYQAEYAASGPLPSTYQYVQAPVFSSGPYCQNDPNQIGNVNSHYLQSSYERYALMNLAHQPVEFIIHLRGSYFLQIKLYTW